MLTKLYFDNLVTNRDKLLNYGLLVCSVSMLCVTVCLVLLWSDVTHSDPPSNQVRLLAPIINGLFGLEHYYNRSYAHLNVDGVFGIRVIQGQMTELSHDLKEGKYPGIPKDMQDKILLLGKRAGQLGNMAVPHVFDTEPQYANQFKYWINVPYTVTFDTPIPVDPKLWWKDTQECEYFDETRSDVCFTELFSGAKARAENLKRVVANAATHIQFGDCVVSKDCLKLFLGTKGCKRYALTHQILYTGVAEQIDCLPPLEQYIKSMGFNDGIQGWRKEFCSNLYLELNTIIRESGGSVHVMTGAGSKDLLMETVFTCGQFGFFEFGSIDFLEAFLSWQSIDGCFREKALAVESVPKTGPHRKLLFERMSPDECLAHMSAVAAGALVTFMKLVLTPLPKEWGHMHVIAQPRTASLAKIKTYGRFTHFQESSLNILPSVQSVIHDESDWQFTESFDAFCYALKLPTTYVGIYLVVVGVLFYLNRRRLSACCKRRGGRAIFIFCGVNSLLLVVFSIFISLHPPLDLQQI